MAWFVPQIVALLEKFPLASVLVLIDVLKVDLVLKNLLFQLLSDRVVTFLGMNLGEIVYLFDKTSARARSLLLVVVGLLLEVGLADYVVFPIDIYPSLNGVLISPAKTRKGILLNLLQILDFVPLFLQALVITKLHFLVLGRELLF